MKVCEKCQVEYPDDMSFCARCGSPLQLKVQEYACPTCGKVLGKDIPKFCPNCGQQLASLGNNNNSDSLDKNDTCNKDHDIHSFWNYIKSPMKIFAVLLFIVLVITYGHYTVVEGVAFTDSSIMVGVFFAGFVGGVIPVFFLYKYYRLDNSDLIVTLLFVVHLVAGYLGGMIFTIPLGLILAILICVLRKK